MTDDRHMTRWPIVPRGKGCELRDRRGARVSFHRTKTGALRKRLDLILAQQKEEGS